MITIQVFSQRTGYPVKSIPVHVCFSGFWRGHTSLKYTDRQGEVHFDSAPGDGTIYADGRVGFTGWVAGRKVVYV